MYPWLKVKTVSQRLALHLAKNPCGGQAQGTEAIAFGYGGVIYGWTGGNLPPTARYLSCDLRGTKSYSLFLNAHGLPLLLFQPTRGATSFGIYQDRPYGAEQLERDGPGHDFNYELPGWFDNPYYAPASPQGQAEIYNKVQLRHTSDFATTPHAACFGCTNTREMPQVRLFFQNTPTGRLLLAPIGLGDCELNIFWQGIHQGDWTAPFPPPPNHEPTSAPGYTRRPHVILPYLTPTLQTTVTGQLQVDPLAVYTHYHWKTEPAGLTPLGHEHL